MYLLALLSPAQAPLSDLIMNFSTGFVISDMVIEFFSSTRFAVCQSDIDER